MHYQDELTWLNKGRSLLEEFQETLFTAESEEHLSKALGFLEDVECSNCSDRDKAIAKRAVETHALKFIQRARVLFENQRPPIEEDVHYVLRILKQLSDASLKTKYDFDAAWNKLSDSGIEAMCHSRIPNTTIIKVRDYLYEMERL